MKILYTFGYSSPIPVRKRPLDGFSYEVVQATLNCLDFVRKRRSFAHRIVLLGGCDYPIKDNRRIASFLRVSNKKIYLDYSKLPTKKLPDGGRSRFPMYEEISEQISLYHGSQPMSFPMSAVKVIFKFIRTNPDFVTYFKAVKIPHESFFHTLFLNCDDDLVRLSIINRNLHLIKTNSVHEVVELDENEYEQMESTKCLFASKFSPSSTSLILDKIDNELLASEKTLPNIKGSSSTSEKKQCVIFLTQMVKKLLM